MLSAFKVIVEVASWLVVVKVPVFPISNVRLKYRLKLVEAVEARVTVPC